MFSNVLFIGLGQSAVAWYRCFMPALFLGADWIGVAGEPPDFHFGTGLVKRDSRLPEDYDAYSIIVVQQAHGLKWLDWIKERQSAGVKVLYEIDDDLHAIRKMPDHDFAKYFDKEYLSGLEMCMRACDGVIASTAHVARRYGHFVGGREKTYVCENGIDTGRYRLTRPPRPFVNIGWSGATAHARALGPWLESVGRVMEARPQTSFVTIGQNFADTLAQHFPNRTISTPFTLIEQYPSAMTMFDIALGPAGKNNFFKGKSDLRFLEAGALGIPIIADPYVYPHIEHGVTGFHAEEPEEVRELLLTLVDDEELRTRVGLNAKRYVEEKRDMKIASHQWGRVFLDLMGIDPEAGRAEQALYEG